MSPPVVVLLAGIPIVLACCRVDLLARLWFEVWRYDRAQRAIMRAPITVEHAADGTITATMPAAKAAAVRRFAAEIAKRARG